MADPIPSAARRRRVPYFERPRPPHDWRFWVGGLGRTLIAMGLLLFAFIAYQLWGTGIQTARAQQSLSNELRAQFATTTTVTTTTTAPPPSTPDSLPSSGPLPTTTTSTTTLPPFPLSSRVELGAPMARLEIPAIHVDYIVVEGVRVVDLQRGPGHFPESRQPGQLGNVAIACHRTTYGAPCYDLDHLRAGDKILLTTTAGTYVYGVTDSEVVSPRSYSQVVPSRDNSSATLALTTCTPIGTANKRLVIHAALLPQLSSPAFSGVTATTIAHPSSVPGGTSPSSNISPTTVEPSSAMVFDSNDAFAQGWFDRPSLVVQCAIWAVLLGLITFVAYRIGRRFHRLWVAFAVGAVPFVVTLYFCFENLNLLLPASI